VTVQVVTEVTVQAVTEVTVQAVTEVTVQVVTEVTASCVRRGGNLKCLNKSLNQSLLLHPVIILIKFFCVLKVLALCEGFPQNINL